MELFFELIKDLLTNIDNMYIWTAIILIILFISEIKINGDHLKEKVVISYLIFLFLRFFKFIPIRFILLFSFVFYFIFIEIIFSNRGHKVMIKNPLYLLLDYIYIMIFKYRIIGFYISLFFISRINYDFIICILPYKNTVNYTLGFLSIIMYLYVINRMSTNKFNTLDFDDTVDKMESIVSFRNYKHDKRLEDFADMLLWYEDRSFLKRKNSFNLLSWSFISYKFNRVRNNRKSKFYNTIFIGGLVKDLVTLLIIIYKIFRNFIFKIRNIIIVLYKIVRKKRKLYSIRTIIRGYSTIEMQLLRTLALKDGYENTIQRKFYELIYTGVFFKSLKNTYRYYVYNNLDEYKYYLLELYIRVAPTFINGKRYNNINLLFKDRDNIFELTNEEFFLFTLGLSNKEISFDKIDDYYCPIKLDRMRYVKAMEEVLGKCYLKYPEENGIEVKMMLYDLLLRKRFPVVAYFSRTSTLKDITNFVKETYCSNNRDTRIDNIIDSLYSSAVSKDSLKCIFLPFEDIELYQSLLKVSIEDLLLYSNFYSLVFNISYNVCSEIGGTSDIENGIRYYFNNNEKSIHAHLPHINCKYAEEDIRIDLLTFKILDKKQFKSPTKTREAINHVKDNQERYLDIWENVVDKDNVLNKKIGNKIYIK